MGADVKADGGMARPRHRWKFPKPPAALRLQDTQSVAATSSAARKAARPAAHVLDSDEWSSDEEDRHEEAAFRQKLSAKRSADGRFAAVDGRRQTSGEQHRASSSGCGGATAGRAGAEAGSAGGPDEAREAALAAAMAAPQRLAKLTANARLSSGQSRTAHKRTGGGGAPGLKPGEPGRFSPLGQSQPAFTANTCMLKKLSKGVPGTASCRLS